MTGRELVGSALRLEARRRYAGADAVLGRPDATAAQRRRAWHARDHANYLADAAADLERCGGDQLVFECCEGHQELRPFTCRRAFVCETCASSYSESLQAKYIPRALELANRRNVPRSERIPKLVTLAKRRPDMMGDREVFHATMGAARRFFRVAFGVPKGRADWRAYRECFPLSPGELNRAGSPARAWRARRRAVSRDRRRRRFGALYAFEWSPSGNPHVHALVFGPWKEQRLLSAVWHAVTGDSRVVDIRAKRRGGAPAEDVTGKVREVLKYVTKFGAHEPGRLAQLAAALLTEPKEGRVRSHRRLDCIGRMRKRGALERRKCWADENRLLPLQCDVCGNDMYRAGRLPRELVAVGVTHLPDHLRFSRGPPVPS